jgi:hypothetical protein
MSGSYIKYDLKSNELIVYHNKFGNSKKEQKVYTEKKDAHGKEIYREVVRKRDQKFLGITFLNFIDKQSKSYQGLKAEDQFKELMNIKNIPCLYIGQGANFSERNPVITYCEKKIRIKRPDFLVSFPELGNLMIDVKSRTRVNFPNSEKKVFYIHYSDVEELFVLRNSMNLPIWIAFKDTDKTDADFWMCNVKILHDIQQKLFEKRPQMKDEENRRTNHLRVPNEILSSFSENKLFNSLSYFKLEGHVERMIDLETREQKPEDKDFYFIDKKNEEMNC